MTPTRMAQLIRLRASLLAGVAWLRRRLAAVADRACPTGSSLPRSTSRRSSASGPSRRRPTTGASCARSGWASPCAKLGALCLLVRAAPRIERAAARLGAAARNPARADLGRAALGGLAAVRGASGSGGGASTTSRTSATPTSCSSRGRATWARRSSRPAPSGWRCCSRAGSAGAGGSSAGRRSWCSSAAVLVLTPLVLSPRLAPLEDRRLAAEIERLAQREGVGDVRRRGGEREPADDRAERRGDRRRADDPRRPVGHAPGRPLHATARSGRSRRTSSPTSARDHLWKGIAWFALFALPCAWLLALLTDRRGGLHRPAVVPFAVLVVVALQLALLPATNLVSRRYEAEADWLALETARDPRAAASLFRKFTTTALDEPDDAGVGRGLAVRPTRSSSTASRWRGPGRLYDDGVSERNAVDRLAGELARLAGAPVELERPAQGRSTATTRRTSPCASAPARGRPPRELAEELAAQAVELPAVERAEVAGPGFLNLWLADAWFARGAGRDRRRDVRRRLGRAPERVAGRDGLRQPDRPDHGRVGAERRLRRRGRAPARVRRPHGRARVLLQRRGRADGPLPGLGRGAAARGGAAGGRLPGRVRRRARRRPRATRCRRCSSGSRRRSSASAIHFDSWALQSELEQRLSELPATRCRPTSRTAPCSVRSTEHGDEKDRVLDPLGRAGGLPTYEAADVVYLQGQARPRLRPGRSTSSAPTTRACARWYEVDRADARLRPRSASRCSSTSSCT